MNVLAHLTWSDLGLVTALLLVASLLGAWGASLLARKTRR
jgi:hypothetical protein